MDSESADASAQNPVKAPDTNLPVRAVFGIENASQDTPFVASVSGISSWARLKLTQPLASSQEDSMNENAGMSTFAHLTSGLGLRLPSITSIPEENAEGGAPTTAQSGVFDSLAKGLVDTSRNAVKTMQVKARHLVSQNKRRYQEGGFDLDMTYITENVIAMGFPAGDMSSGFFFGYVEGFYRNHMEEVIKFFETHHKVTTLESGWSTEVSIGQQYAKIFFGMLISSEGLALKEKYKVYNLCAERLYDASVFEGKVACFPFDDHNCPPMHLIKSFCESAQSWLKMDSQNVVVVHCKAGMARTGLMICSLLLYLKFFPTAEEVIDYYNPKRCVDGKGLVLPSQIRYVKYYERVLRNFNGEIPPGRRCMLRGFRLHKCPYWIRPSITISDHNGILFSTKKHPKTKNLMPEDFWINASRKGIVVFALPGEAGVTELVGDFKIHFHDRQGDFYCWINTTMTENRFFLNPEDLDAFDKRKLPSPGFQVEVVMVDYDRIIAEKTKADFAPEGGSGYVTSDRVVKPSSNQTSSQEKDDVFSDSDDEKNASTKIRQARSTGDNRAATTDPKPDSMNEQIGNLTRGTEQISLGKVDTKQSDSTSKLNGDAVAQAESSLDSAALSDIKAMAADASVFSFGDDEDFSE